VAAFLCSVATLPITDFHLPDAAYPRQVLEPRLKIDHLSPPPQRETAREKLTPATPAEPF